MAAVLKKFPAVGTKEWEKMPITKSSKNQFSDIINLLFHRYQQLCIRRDGWRNVFWLLSKYLLMRPVWFGDTGIPWNMPRLSVVNVSDDTSVDAAYGCAMALGGALWPNTAESFSVKLRALPESMSNMVTALSSEDVNEYLQEVTKKVHHAVDQPKAGWLMAWGEHLVEQVVYGTSGIYPEEQDDDDEVPVYYRSISVETCVIDEGKNKQVDSVFMEFAYTAKEVVDTYGYNNCSDRVKGLYDSDMYADYIKVIHAILPRPQKKDSMGRDTILKGAEKLKKPYASVHFEYDTKNILKEDGMDEFPVFITRFTKRPNEVYGRSLGLNALPSVKELNVLRKAYSLAVEKRADPPLGFYHDQIGGGGQVNIGAGARVPLYATGRLPQGQQPIIQLYEIPDPASAGQRAEELTERIAGKFLLDKLLDFNNKTRMTAEETRERVGFKEQALGMIFCRQQYECLDPTMDYTVKVMWKRRLLGLHPQKDRAKINELTNQGFKPLVMPTIVAKMSDMGWFPFCLHWISPAARAMRSAGTDGLERLTNYGMAWANAGHPEALDNIDIDESMREAQHLYGAPIKIMRGKDSMLKTRKSRNAAGAQQIQLQQGEVQATIAQKSATAAKNYAMAQKNGGQSIPGLNGQLGGQGGPQENS